MVTEREYLLAETILSILDNHREWSTEDTLDVIIDRLGVDHTLAASQYFNAQRVVKEYEDGQ